jgi:small subunit ribosomal protein S17
MADEEKNEIEETTEAAEPEAEAEAPAAAEDAPSEEPAAEADEPAAEAEAEPAAEPEEEAAPAKPSRSQRHVPRTERRQRPKRVRGGATTRKPITRLPKPEHERGRNQERRGVVVSDKGDKTIVVKVDVIKSHPKYKKVVRRTVKFHAHDEQNEAGLGDTVRIVETRPLSKTKRWRLAEIVEKAR